MTSMSTMTTMTMTTMTTEAAIYTKIQIKSNLVN